MNRYPRFLGSGDPRAYGGRLPAPGSLFPGNRFAYSYVEGSHVHQSTAGPRFHAPPPPAQRQQTPGQTFYNPQNAASPTDQYYYQHQQQNVYQSYGGYEDYGDQSDGNVFPQNQNQSVQSGQLAIEAPPDTTQQSFQYDTASSRPVPLPPPPPRMPRPSVTRFQAAHQRQQATDPGSVTQQRTPRATFPNPNQYEQSAPSTAGYTYGSDIYPGAMEVPSDDPYPPTYQPTRPRPSASLGGPPSHGGPPPYSEEDYQPRYDPPPRRRRASAAAGAPPPFNEEDQYDASTPVRDTRSAPPPRQRQQPPTRRYDESSRQRTPKRRRVSVAPDDDMFPDNFEEFSGNLTFDVEKLFSDMNESIIEDNIDEEIESNDDGLQLSEYEILTIPFKDLPPKYHKQRRLLQKRIRQKRYLQGLIDEYGIE